jgi:hypothetical protein
VTRAEQYLALAAHSMQLHQAAIAQPARCRPCPYCGEPAPAIGADTWQCRNDCCPVQGSFGEPKDHVS